MREMSPQLFLDKLSYGMEQTFSFRGKVFFVEGVTLADGSWMSHLDQWEPVIKDDVWVCGASSMTECLSAFVAAPIFDGLTFWEAETEMVSLYS